MAKGSQDPNLHGRLVETAGCVRLRGPHSRLTPLRALTKWNLWSVDIKDACL